MTDRYQLEAFAPLSGFWYAFGIPFASYAAAADWCKSHLSGFLDVRIVEVDETH